MRLTNRNEEILYCLVFKNFSQVINSNIRRSNININIKISIIIKAPFRLLCFVQKRREKPPFCESVHTDPHKSATKRRLLKTLQYPTMSFTKTEQCERTKTDYQADQRERTKTEVSLRFVQKRSSVTGSFEATKTDANKNGAV